MISTEQITTTSQEQITTYKKEKNRRKRMTAEQRNKTRDVKNYIYLSLKISKMKNYNYDDTILFCYLTLCKEGCKDFPQISKTISRNIYKNLPFILFEEHRDYCDDNGIDKSFEDFLKEFLSFPKNDDDTIYDKMNELLKFFIIKYYETNVLKKTSIKINKETS